MQLHAAFSRKQSFASFTVFVSSAQTLSHVAVKVKKSLTATVTALRDHIASPIAVFSRTGCFVSPGVQPQYSLDPPLFAQIEFVAGACSTNNVLLLLLLQLHPPACPSSSRHTTTAVFSPQRGPLSVEVWKCFVRVSPSLSWLFSVFSKNRSSRGASFDHDGHIHIGGPCHVLRNPYCVLGMKRLFCKAAAASKIACCDTHTVSIVCAFRSCPPRMSWSVVSAPWTFCHSSLNGRSRPRRLPCFVLGGTTPAMEMATDRARICATSPAFVQ